MIHASSSQPANDFVRVGAIAGFEGPKQQLGVLMSDGVTELGVSGMADPLEGSLAARTLFGSADRTIIRSANGFQFVPRNNFETLPAVDRVLVAHPGENPSAKQQVVSAWTTHQPRRPVEDIYQSAGDGQMAYDVSFADITRTRNGSLARAPATVLLHACASQVATTWLIGEVFD